MSAIVPAEQPFSFKSGRVGKKLKPNKTKQNITWSGLGMSGKEMLGKGRSQQSEKQMTGGVGEKKREEIRSERPLY